MTYSLVSLSLLVCSLDYFVETTALAASPKIRAKDKAEQTDEDAKDSTDDSEEDNENELAIELNGMVYGDVDVLSAEAQIPIGTGWSILAGADLIRTPHRTGKVVRPYGQAGFGLSLSATSRLELLGEYGPTVSNLGRAGAIVAVSSSFGTSTYSASEPKLNLRAEVTGLRYWWADRQGPAGSDLFQAIAELSAVANIDRFQISVQQGAFFYDRSLISGRNDVEVLGDLARAGTYAPSWLLGVTVGFHVTDWMMPLLSLEEIGYAADVGSASLVSAGGKIDVGIFQFELRAGALYNRLDPNVLGDSGWLPVVGLSISMP